MGNPGGSTRCGVMRVVLCRVVSAVRAGGRWLLHNRVAVGITSLAWLIVRSGAQPRRLGYPCQRAAAANVSALAVAAAAGLAVPEGLRRRLMSHRIFRTAAVVVAAGAIAWFTVPPLFYAEIPPAAIQQHQLADEASYGGAELSTTLVYPSSTEAVVSVARDMHADYVSESPHDQQGNPVYLLVWRAVEQLGIGTEGNPLKGFIGPGDRVLIKPNIEGSAPLQHTRPCVVRPLIDMAAKAGAGQIIVAESSPVGTTARNLVSSGYVKMVDELNKRGMPCKLAAVSLDERPWSWVNLGKASAYTPGKFEDEDLCSAKNNTYHKNPDSHGRTTGGRILNNYALYDALFEADVVIDAPRLKVHGIMVNTLAIKNLVGITVSSTKGSDRSENFARIAHFGSVDGPEHMVQGLGNDIAWRELANINRALFYWKDGRMHDRPQRKVLCVLDAIACGNGPHGAGTKVKVGAILASVDPIAIDAVGSRLMRYDFRTIPLINNATLVPSHHFGTHDPARVRLVGDAIGKDIAFLFSNRWENTEEFGPVVVNDVTPPQPSDPVHTVKDGRLAISVQRPGACAVFLYYKQGAGPIQVARMARREESFTCTLADRATDYYLVAQDRFFNTAGASKHYTYVPKQ